MVENHQIITLVYTPVQSCARRRLAELQTGPADFMSLAVAVRALRDLRTL